MQISYDSKLKCRHTCSNKLLSVLLLVYYKVVRPCNKLRTNYHEVLSLVQVEETLDKSTKENDVVGVVKYT